MMQEYSEIHVRGNQRRALTVLELEDLLSAAPADALVLVLGVSSSSSSVDNSRVVAAFGPSFLCIVSERRVEPDHGR